jgi:hypothetical protein
MATVVTFNRELYPCFESNINSSGILYPDSVDGTETQTTVTWVTDLSPADLQTVNDCIGACKYGMTVATYQSVALNIEDVKLFRQMANADITNNDQSKAIKDLAKIVFAHLKDD